MYKLDFNEPDSKAVLSFNGPLTIQNISAIREAMLSALNKADIVLIYHYGVEEFDISYLQILIAVEKSMTMAGKKLIIKSDGKDAFRKFLEDSGCRNVGWRYENADLTERGGENE